MSSYIRLDDLTEYRFHFGGRSNKAVLVGFELSELEKFLSTASDTIVEADGERMTYNMARKRLGSIVAYLPNPEVWLRVSNYL